MRKKLFITAAAFAIGSLAAMAQDEPQMQGHRGLDFSVEAGPLFTLNSGGATSFNANVEVGKKFNKNFYFGVGGGISVFGESTSFPIKGMFRAFMPSHKTKVLPYIGVGGGYAISDAGCPFVELAPGVLIPISPCVDLKAGISYNASFGDGYTAHGLGVHVGLNIHSSTAASNKPKKPWAPTRKQGLQYVIELAAREPWNFTDAGTVGLNVLGMYKWDDNISFGVGLGYGDGHFPYKYDKYDRTDAYPSKYYNVFVRGKYRMSENKIAPFASVDLGAHFLTDEHEAGNYQIHDNIGKGTVLFAIPAVGVSFKVAGNSYIDVKAGYELATSPVKGDKFSGKMPGINIGVSFTHTMDILTKGLF